MKKKIIGVFCLLLSLSSCSGTTPVVDVNSLTTYKWKGFTLDIPAAWVVMDLNNSWSVSLPNPREWALELVVSSKEEKSWFINNLIVLSKDLEEATTSYDFITKNNPRNYKWYEYFYEEANKDFVFTDWEKSKLYIFLAKYNKDNDKLRFIQTARVCDEKKSFFLTIGVSLDINDTAKYEDIFKSFKCD